jgi:RHS repeat-associated protein
MKKLFPYLTFFLSTCFLLPQTSRGEVGNDNPTGVTGEYNGSITTAGSYDPYTGNAKRFVDDLTVPGALGAYPLKWTRVLNTRNSGWLNSYNWGLWLRVPDNLYHDPPYEGPDGMISYPDGRQVNLFYDQANTYTVDGGSETFDRLVYAGGGNYDLVMPDGGRVRFEPPAGATGTSVYFAQKIVDPYGQETVLTYDSATANRRLLRVTEPGGRYLDLSGLPARVQAFDGRGNLIETVTYTYTQLSFPGGGMTGSFLTRVNYDDGTAATYTYQANNVNANGYGLIRTCDDVRYAGAMKKIEYEFMTWSNDHRSIAIGQVRKEKNATTHQTVSEIVYPPDYPPPSPYPAPRRTEIRGDGSTRSFQYNGNELESYTDFKNQPSSIAHSAVPGHNIKTLTDARGNATSIERDWITGAVLRVTHPGYSYVTYTYSDPSNPYYMASRTDELNHTTYYDRDGNNRIWRTRYPDDSFEQFTYNGFGQIETHTMTSGGVENFRYDSRGLKYLSWPPATPSDPNPQDHPTQYFYYTSGPNTDRLWYVVDPRNNTTWYEYNGRGQVTKVTHQDGNYTQSHYNPDGTLEWTADENHPGAVNDPNQRTRYTYDEYKRVLTVTNLLNQTTTNSYEPWSGIGSLSHTTASVYWSTSPSGKMTHFAYDENFRRTIMRQAPGTADDAWTYFGYDAVGNLSWTQDPRNYVTNFGYDNRNRQTSVTDALGHITSTTYDDAGNKTTVTRPGNPPVQFVEYDPMNRLKHQIDERGVHTYLHYDDAARNLTSQEDGNGKTYFYTYDPMNRKSTMTYPPETSGAVRSESWSYDPAGNLATHTNRAGAVQTFAPYDNRNRPTSFSWSDGTQGQSFQYDPASRVTALHNAEADIVNTYDDANRHTSETETIKSYGLWAQRSTAYQYDDDGNRSRLIYPQGYQFIYGYTQRHQLDNIKLDPAIFGGTYNTPLVRYTYDASGNRTMRTVLSGAHAEYDVDELNRIRGQANYFANGHMGSFDYGFDALGRRRYEQRDGGTADGYQYDPSDEVTGYQRDGTLNGDGTVSASFWNNSGLVYDNNGNRTQVTGSGANSYVINNLNQYTSDAVTGTMLYDTKGNLTSAAGWTYTYDAQNRLRTMQGPGMTITLTYDPLNRVITRNVNGAVTQNVWEGWNLIEEHRPDWSIQRCYLQGANQNEMVAAFDGGVYTNHWFWQDGRGNTSHITGDAANLFERYTYDLSGAPKFYDEWDNERFGGSVYDTRFLFAGSQYLPETGLYDMRNRFYSPVLNRFLQTDPIGFAGDALNLYRYCGDDPVDRSDPMGLDYGPFDTADQAYHFFDAKFNNRSIRENREYRVEIYQGTGTGKFYTTAARAGSENQTNPVPIQVKHARYVGPAHSHGDWSTGFTDRNGMQHVTGRAKERRLDSFNSGEPSKTDRKIAGEHTVYTSTPAHDGWRQSPGDKNPQRIPTRDKNDQKADAFKPIDANAIEQQERRSSDPNQGAEPGGSFQIPRGPK